MKKYVICGLLVLALVLPVAIKAQTTNLDEATASLLKQVELLKQQIAELQKQLSQVEQQVQEIIKFTKTLRKGEANEEVKRLQEFLKTDPEIYPEGTVTGYFGPLTEKAVKKFQEKHAEDVLKPLGLSEGTGVVGPKTMETMNKVLEEVGKSGKVPPGLLNKQEETSTTSSENKITICHIPSENTANKQTITIDKSALSAHLTHGDTVGVCVAEQQPTQVACTADAKLCPNGSYVSRIAPNCEFAPCPNQPTTQYSITILSPNGGEIWTTGSSQYIKWSTNIPFNYKILTIRLRDSSGVEHYLLENTENDMVEQITVPTTLAAGAYKLEIKTIAGDQTVFDASDTMFNIVAPTATVATPVKIEGPFFLKILYPNGGEQLEAGKTYEVHWTTTNVPLNAKMFIRIVLLGGSYIYDPPEFSNLTNTGKASWTIPENMYLGSYRVDASVSFGSSLASDGSDTSFKIINPGSVTTPSLTVVSPNGGETWYMGKTHDILWKSSGVNRVNIEVNVRKDGIPVGSLSIAGSDIATPATTGKYSWTLNSNHLREGNQFKIVIRNAEEPYTPEDESDSYFSIVDIPVSIPTSTPTPAPSCTDTDNGYDFTKYGEVTDYLFRNYKDTCIPDLSGLSEFACRADGLYTSQFHSCVNDGKICSAGVCVAATGNSWCKDSDGLNYDQYGIVEYLVEGKNYSSADYCSGEQGVVETHCNNKQKMTQYHSCVNDNKICKNGACVPSAETSSCNDSDSGYDFTKFGVVEYSVAGITSKTEDSCSSIYELNEVACSGNQKTSQFHSCKEDGKICQNGACVNSTSAILPDESANQLAGVLNSLNSLLNDLIKILKK